MCLLVDQLGKISRRETCAGWGFTVMKSYQARDEAPMVEACGLVQLDEGREYYVGAIRATNNTAEMQALIEALFRLNTCAEHKGLPSSSKVVITVDSLYVMGLIDEKFVAKENRDMATLLCFLWKATQTRWVRGDTCDVVIPLQMSWQIGSHVRKSNNIGGGREFSRWVSGRKMPSKKT